MRVRLILNGDAAESDVAPRQSLLDLVRGMGLTGTHTGCEHGVCGACSVRVNGRVLRGCLMLAVQADGAAVETVEGLTRSGEIADLQDAFHRRNALQCGFCTAGMLLTAQELLMRGKAPSRKVIREHMSGNYCRCTGYQSIVDAIEAVMIRRAEASS